MVIKFSAEWCQPCKRITPLYEALAKEYAQQYIFTVVDVDDLPDLAVDCGAKVLPTFQVWFSVYILHGSSSFILS